MEKVVCAVRDSALAAFMNPFCSPSTGGAVRAFSDEVNRPESEMGKHPEDYELWNLGFFDESTGKFDCPGGPVLISRGKDVRVLP